MAAASRFLDPNEQCICNVYTCMCPCVCVYVSVCGAYGTMNFPSPVHDSLFVILFSFQNLTCAGGTARPFDPSGHWTFTSATCWVSKRSYTDTGKTRERRKQKTHQNGHEEMTHSKHLNSSVCLCCRCMCVYRTSQSESILHHVLCLLILQHLLHIGWLQCRVIRVRADLNRL